MWGHIVVLLSVLPQEDEWVYPCPKQKPDQMLLLNKSTQIHSSPLKEENNVWQSVEWPDGKDYAELDFFFKGFLELQEEQVLSQLREKLQKQHPWGQVTEPRTVIAGEEDDRSGQVTVTAKRLELPEFCSWLCSYNLPGLGFCQNFAMELLNPSQLPGTNTDTHSQIHTV